MQLYELTLVLPGSFDEAKLKTVLERFEKTVRDTQGSIVQKDDWGKRALSYPIKKNSEGIFVLYQVELQAERVNPISRLIQNDEQVLRHLLVKSNLKNPKSVVSETKEAKKPQVETKAKKEVKSEKKVKAKTTKSKSKAKKK